MQAGNTHQEWNSGQTTAHEHTEMAPQSQIPISLVWEPGGKDSATTRFEADRPGRPVLDRLMASHSKIAIFPDLE